MLAFITGLVLGGTVRLMTASLMFAAKRGNVECYAAQPHSFWHDFPQIDLASRRLQKVIIENKDFEKLLAHYDRESSFFYCDPPYFATESYYKDVGFTTADHIRLRDALMNSMDEAEQFAMDVVDVEEKRYWEVLKEME